MFPFFSLFPFCFPVLCVYIRFSKCNWRKECIALGKTPWGDCVSNCGPRRLITSEVTNTTSSAKSVMEMCDSVPYERKGARISGDCVEKVGRYRVVVFAMCLWWVCACVAVVGRAIWANLCEIRECGRRLRGMVQTDWDGKTRVGIGLLIRIQRYRWLLDCSGRFDYTWLK